MKVCNIFLTIDPHDGGSEVRRKKSNGVKKITQQKKETGRRAGDKKLAGAGVTKDGRKRPNYVGNKPSKSKVKVIKDDVFEV